MQYLSKIRQSARRISPAGWQLAAFTIVHLVILGIWMNYSSFHPRFHPDVGLYFEYASNMAAGYLPYKDFLVEYPPLALALLLIPRIFTDTLTGYADVFAFLMFGFNLAGLYFTSWISLKLGLSHIKSLIIYTAVFWALGDIVINRFDIVPAVLTLAAVYFYVSGKYKTAWFMVGIGALIKIYPLVLLPFFAVPFIIRKKYRDLIKGLLITGLTGLSLVIPSLIISPSGFWEFINFHSIRGLQVESTYASLLMLANLLGLTSIETVNGFASVDLDASTAGFFITASTLITCLVLIGCYLVYFCLVARHGYCHDALVSFALGAVILLVASSKVFSTQFVVWFYPLIPLIGNRMRSFAWVIFIPVALISTYIYPHNYGELVALEQPAVALLIIRNILVVALGPLVMAASWKKCAARQM